MEDWTDKEIYSEEVIEFVRQAAAYCTWLENSATQSRKPWFEKLRTILADLYHQALKLPTVEAIYPGENQKFVKEEDYNRIRGLVRKKAGQWDEYPEVFDPQEPIEELEITARISEDCADIYQELKDFITLYHIGSHEVMNDALWEARENFDRLWGQKLLNVLRVIHRLLTFADLSEEEEEDTEDKAAPRNTDDWFITKRQEDYRKGKA